MHIAADRLAISPRKQTEEPLTTMYRKEIFLLIGQKGSGKSFVGTILEKEFGIKFIRVEDWARRIRKDREIDNEDYHKQVFAEIEKGIRNTLKENDRLTFESTGLTEYFDKMVERLKDDFDVTTIAIIADGETCLERVKTRDQSIHINVSDDQVLAINEKVREKNLKTNFLIHNENKTYDQLIEELKQLFEPGQNKIG